MKYLFINQAFDQESVPHYGIAMLGIMLESRGHEVKVLDYAYRTNLPPVEKVFQQFGPDAVGITMYSYTQPLCDETIDKIRQIDPKIPIVVGGPHTAGYHHDLEEDTRIDVIVVGESENAIVEIMEKAKRNPKPELIKTTLPEVKELPYPNYTSFEKYEEMKIYPLVSSRGCPYKCNFCSVGIVNSRQWRPRTAENCVREIEEAGKILKELEHFVIWDDMFNLRKDRGKELLKALIQSKEAGHFPYTMQVANLRADKLDEEMVEYMKRAGCEVVQLGAEHGDPEVFEKIDKGETLEAIERASFITKNAGLKLCLSFIIGLPGDSLKATFNSIRFAKRVHADKSYWNVMVPYKGTTAYQYFREEGQVNDDKIPFTLMSGIYTAEPNAETKEFTAEERLLAHKIASIFTGNVGIRGNLFSLFLHSIKYGFTKDFFALVKEKAEHRLSLVVSH